MLRQLRRAAKRNDAVVRAVRGTYPALSWIANRRPIYTRVAPYLAEMEFDEVRLGGRGNEPATLLRRTARAISLRDADILVLGVGRGEELGLWEQQRPRSLVATDYFAQPAAWGARPAASFAQADVRRLPFADASFDLVASTALLEHVNGVDDVVREMARVVRPAGLVFANFAPLYYTHGGAHFLGAYEHLWMSDEQFQAYLSARGIQTELEEGAFWLRNNMFSRLRYDEYLAIFKSRFELDHVVLAVSADAQQYKRAHPSEWAALRERHAERDLLTYGMTVWMRPRAAARRPAAQCPVAVAA
jgi:SAM-dependent methyltransferase